jgi:dihydrofolate synthase/folylpolyglutamate synthase
MLVNDSLREREWLYGLTRVGIKLGTDHVRELYSRMDSPQEHFASVHVAGTNGKGSVANFIASVLSHAGYKTGLYTSPHIVDVRERIRIDGMSIPEDKLLALVEEIRDGFGEGEISFFEATTLIAFRYFAEEDIDVAVVETGLGGRLDATNVVESALSVITSVGVDHVKYLGSDIRQIASEKAGIIRPGRPVVTCTEGAALEVIQEVAGNLESPVTTVNDTCADRFDLLGSSFSWRFNGREISLSIPLAGRHQVLNAKLALEAVSSLVASGWKVAEESIEAGFDRAFWPGRLQSLGAPSNAIVDVAHNPMAMNAVVSALEEISPGTKFNCVFGVCEDKDWQEMLNCLARVSGEFILTQADNQRSLDSSVMLGYLEGTAKTRAIARPDEAVICALALDGPTLVTGSHYLLGDVWSTLDGPSLDYLWDD